MLGSLEGPREQILDASEKLNVDAHAHTGDALSTSGHHMMTNTDHSS